ncbi:MAG: dihydrodipicolinate synthase family protein [Pseudomonadota bacterium]
MNASLGPRGVWAAALTPLAPDGACAEHRLVVHCRHLLESGCDGIVLFGTTGEGPSFAVAERRAALEAAIGAGLPPDRIMVATGCAALPDVVDLTAHAVASGAAGVVMLPPFFFKEVGEDGVFDAYAYVIDRVADPGLRLYAYNIPDVTAVAVAPRVIRRLRDRFGAVLAGVKDSSGDWSSTWALIGACPDVAVFVGAEPDLPRALAAGAAGTISGLANLVPGLIRRLHDTGDPQLGADIEALVGIFAGRQFVPALKALVAHATNDPRWRGVRPPLVALAGGELPSLLAALASAGVRLAADAAAENRPP